MRTLSAAPATALACYSNPTHYLLNPSHAATRPVVSAFEVDQQVLSEFELEIRERIRERVTRNRIVGAVHAIRLVVADGDVTLLPKASEHGPTCSRVSRV